MKSAEALALELRHFAGEGLKTIVPMVYGLTERAQTKVPGVPKRQWDEESVLSDLKTRNGPQALAVATRIAQWMKDRADSVWFGSGGQDGSMGMTIVANGHNYYPLAIWSYGRVEIRFQYLLTGPFESEEKRREFLERLNKVHRISLPTNSITGRLSIPILALLNETRLDQFLKVMDWLVEQLKGGYPNADGNV